ncbi:uncharacterized protein K452DRAFT_305306 [Aplosporella prunicola CBS 121167]|uniref:Uncharacterized protein n=1 Tax=Aplosporella prunicola CBS 121167 TaxID=1176127 RepID=A0A6A6BQI2_9PEZI|nr:uncharacterized protein K452DRAFT_305306 [Aplosporella prunicola CBS 121167]KAF2146369.1 hypothetical protein K452DRAFT_305306 [Aplosporella prunicola CBS 121167]
MRAMTDDIPDTQRSRLNAFNARSLNALNTGPSNTTQSRSQSSSVGSSNNSIKEDLSRSSEECGNIIENVEDSEYCLERQSTHSSEHQSTRSSEHQSTAQDASKKRKREHNDEATELGKRLGQCLEEKKNRL